MDHALRLFAARGFDAVGVQEIVEAAGVTKPTLYHYFGSKSGLLDAILREHFRALIGKVEKAADYQHDITLTLQKVVEAYFDFARENGTFYRFQLALTFAPVESDGYQAVLKYHEQQFDIIERLFLLAAEDHGNMRGRHRRYAVTFMGLINNMITLWLNGHAELDKNLVYDATHQFMHGIFS
ncbi:MAG: helix-turn-helix transcriptional regulator [Anaerolineae bacterium]|nr:helix-turn-helix transcriptional regulator [Anaerolineae bacterium]